LGTIQYIHPTYGIFVSLEAGVKVSAGDTLEVLKEGKVVGSIRVERVTPPDKEYPNGCAVCKPAGGEVAKDRAVRKAKP
jgi:endonuclease YncB( thermonuclease family)